MATTRHKRAHGTKPGAAKESDVAANEAILAHAEFARTVKSWLSVPGYGDGSGDEEDPAAGGDDGGAVPNKRGGAGALVLEEGEVGNSDMGGLGFIAPKDSNGRPVTATAASDPTTAFLRKQLLGNRGRHAPPPPPTAAARSRGGGNPHAAVRGMGKRSSNSRDDGSDDDEEDSRSRARKTTTKSTDGGRAAKIDSVVEADAELRDDDDGGGGGGDKVQTGAQPGETEHQAPDESPSLDASPPPLPPAVAAAKSVKRGPTSYLDEVLAERARKKKKKKNK